MNDLTYKQIFIESDFLWNPILIPLSMVIIVLSSLFFSKYCIEDNKLALSKLIILVSLPIFIVFLVFGFLRVTKGEIEGNDKLYLNFAYTVLFTNNMDNPNKLFDNPESLNFVSRDDLWNFPRSFKDLINPYYGVNYKDVKIDFAGKENKIAKNLESGFLTATDEPNIIYSNSINGFFIPAPILKLIDIYKIYSLRTLSLSDMTKERANQYYALEKLLLIPFFKKENQEHLVLLFNMISEDGIIQSYEFEHFVYKINKAHISYKEELLLKIKEENRKAFESIENEKKIKIKEINSHFDKTLKNN